MLLIHHFAGVGKMVCQSVYSVHDEDCVMSGFEGSQPTYIAAFIDMLVVRFSGVIVR